MVRTKLIVMLGLLFALPMVMKAEAQLQRISVNLEDVSVVTLIKELKRQTGLDFLYNVDEVTRNGNVSVSVKDVTVEEVLKASLSEKGLGFSIVNDVIVIKPLEGGVVAQQEELVVIKGVVKDEGGEPLPGVTVMVAGTTVGVTTNANGEFSLVKPTGSNIGTVFCGHEVTNDCLERAGVVECGDGGGYLCFGCRRCDLYRLSAD